jgi:hypothetical protein
MNLYTITEDVHGDFTTLTLAVDSEYTDSRTFQTTDTAGFERELRALTAGYIAWVRTFTE